MCRLIGSPKKLCAARPRTQPKGDTVHCRPVAQFRNRFLRFSKVCPKVCQFMPERNCYVLDTSDQLLHLEN